MLQRVGVLSLERFRVPIHWHQAPVVQIHVPPGVVSGIAHSCQVALTGALTCVTQRLKIRLVCSWETAGIPLQTHLPKLRSGRRPLCTRLGDGLQSVRQVEPIYSLQASTPHAVRINTLAETRRPAVTEHRGHFLPEFLHVLVCWPLRPVLAQAFSRWARLPDDLSDDRS